MCQVKEELLDDAVPVALPDVEDEDIAALDEANYRQFVGRAALNHLKRVRGRNTFAILVANFDKHGIEDYIGPSTFAEIAAAASHGKRIFILNEFPPVYRDLLSAWKAVPLHGRLDPLVQLYRDACGERERQLDLQV
ncbi:hypothetical protein [Sphingomonas molluscorum]|uniref:hypothetical protein n=1 Tax=Sphingomonas molluscorum TaxID=418184 RepID=UPI0031DB32EC